MKNLELVIYPMRWLSGQLITTEAPGATITEPIDVDYWVQCKRFTDAELAAEYWQAHAFHERAVRGESCIELIMEREVEVWTRFATLPHH